MKTTVSELGFPDVKFGLVTDALSYVAKRSSKNFLCVGIWSAWTVSKHYGRTIRWRRCRWYYNQVDMLQDRYAGLIIEQEDI